MKTIQQLMKSLSPKERGCNPDHHGYMLNGIGVHLLCMWADCEYRGLNKYHVDIFNGGTDMVLNHLIFCSPLHRALFVNSHREMGYTSGDADTSGKFF